MLMNAAVRMNRWLASHRRLATVVGWTCFALVCADYARFIDIPPILLVPFWAGVVLNVLRWTVWEGLVKPKVEARMAEAEATRVEAAELPALGERLRD
jgi:hypothetical protein